MTWTEALAIGQLVALIASIIGGYFGLRSVLAKSEMAVQQHIRQALHDENELLQSQVARLEKELRHIKALTRLLIETLKKHQGIEVHTDNESVTIRNNGQTLTAYLPPDPSSGT